MNEHKHCRSQLFNHFPGASPFNAIGSDPIGGVESGGVGEICKGHPFFATGETPPLLGHPLRGRPAAGGYFVPVSTIYTSTHLSTLPPFHSSTPYRLPFLKRERRKTGSLATHRFNALHRLGKPGERRRHRHPSRHCGGTYPRAVVRRKTRISPIVFSGRCRFGRPNSA